MMSQQQMLETVVGGYKRQKRTFPPAYMEQPQKRWVAPPAFKRSLEEEYGTEAARIIGAGKWPTELELEAELTRKLGAPVDIPALGYGEIILGYEWTGSELQFTKSRVAGKLGEGESYYQDWLAYKTAYEKYPVEKYPATIDVISTTDPWGYKPVTSTERGYAEALDEQRFTEWVKAAKQVDIAPKTLTPEQLRAELQGQLPEGAELTYFFESKPGEYSVSYNLPHEEAQKTKIIRSDLSGPFRDWLNTILGAPSVADLGKIGAGAAMPITDIDVLMGAVTIASVAAPIIQRKYWPTPQQSYYQAMGKMSKELYAPTSLEKIGLKQEVNPEMWLNVQQPLETARFQPAEQWYRITRGTPTTPFSKTLEAAIFKDKPWLIMGGISAEQTLIPKSWLMPPALEGLRMQLKLAPTTRIFPFIGLWSMQRQSLKQATMTIPKPQPLPRTILEAPVRLFERQRTHLLQQSLVIPKLAQSLKTVSITMTAQTQVQKTVQIQKQVQAQMQGLRQITSGKMFTQKAFASPFRFELPKTALKTKPSDLFGRWYRRGHKIRTPVEAAGVFGFKLRKGKGGVHL